MKVSLPEPKGRLKSNELPLILMLANDCFSEQEKHYQLSFFFLTLQTLYSTPGDITDNVD